MAVAEISLVPVLIVHLLLVIVVIVIVVVLVLLQPAAAKLQPTTAAACGMTASQTEMERWDGWGLAVLPED